MGLFDKMKQAAANVSGNQTVTFTFQALPESLAQMQALPEASLDTPFKTAALTVCALCAYGADKNIGLEMLNWLRGPRPMNGQEVYKFAVRTVPKVIAGAVEAAGLSMDEIDFFLLHQANLRIIEAVAKRLHQPMEKFPTNLQKYGNISSASVPILLDNVNNHGMIGEGSKIVLAGFGAGLTWGAAVLRWQAV